MCTKYKEGLKLLAFENFLEAESLFESLIVDSMFDEIETETSGAAAEKTETERDLVRLKYAILKNLCFINKEKTHDYSKALEFIIKVYIFLILLWLILVIKLKFWDFPA